MKKINLLMIDNIFDTNPDILSDETIKEYLRLTELKEQELITLNRLCKSLKTSYPYHHLFGNYYLNYKIPQIGKEFDLLRIGNKQVINIELKSQKKDDAEILKQLKRNHYYLSFLKKDIYCFTFITDDTVDRYFYYDAENGSLQEMHDNSKLIGIIASIKDLNVDNINGMFEPSNYLISPFNTTEEFVKDEYFLTHQQELIKKEIIKKISENAQDKIFSISGAAGTGKTLLTYDIAKALRSARKNVTIIHCAQSNEGIVKLQNDYGWNIVTIRDYNTAITSSSEVIIFDESQRISKFQLDNIISNEKKFIIFSHDVNQRLNRTNQAEMVVEHIQNLSGQNSHKLTNKVRHNKKLASFILKFFNLNKIASDDLTKDDYEDISFYFTQNIDDAAAYIEYLKCLGWEHIYLTNSLRRSEPLDVLQFSSHNSSHQVIGQEYDNVVVTIDKNFYYTEDKKLSYRVNTYYNPLETLFQAITRTRKKLTFVIIDNENIYKRCIQIVERKIES